MPLKIYQQRKQILKDQYDEGIKMKIIIVPKNYYEY